MNTRFIDVAVLTLAALPAIALLAVGNLTEAHDAQPPHATLLSQNTADAGPAQKLAALTAHG
jgi:hypothetical protein